MKTQKELLDKLSELYDMTYKTSSESTVMKNYKEHSVLDKKDGRYYNRTVTPTLKIKERKEMCQCGYHTITINIQEKYTLCEKCHKKNPYQEFGETW